MAFIDVENLVKEYYIKPKSSKEDSFIQKFKNLFIKDVKRAADGISFKIEKGEMVGYIGPNGAGKSTTIKMLTGILVPTSGKLEVDGLVPYKDRRAYTKKIGVVFGQRTQLWWDLPLIDSFKLIRYIYDIPKNVYMDNMESFRNILGLDEFIHTPVRQLSLGQRMRADFAASLLHNPEILFLDEPTIGLDAFSKENIRNFVKYANKERNVTLILTTHDMNDIEELCSRVVVIDNGRRIYDGSLEELRVKYSNQRILVVDIAQNEVALPPKTSLIHEDGGKKWISFDRDESNASEIISTVMKLNRVTDISIKDENIESIIKKLYLEGGKGSGLA